MNDFRLITVTEIPQTNDLNVHNPTSFKLLGKGSQGAVFQLSDDTCVKIYADPRNVSWEKQALAAVEGSPFFPVMHEAGPNYIIMEYCKGQTMWQYLKENKEVTDGILKQFLAFLLEMKRARFNRIDTRFDHIIISNEGKVKVIDHIGALHTYRSKPEFLFRDMKKVNLLERFLLFARTEDNAIIQEW